MWQSAPNRLGPIDHEDCICLLIESNKFKCSYLRIWLVPVHRLNWNWGGRGGIIGRTKNEGISRRFVQNGGQRSRRNDLTLTRVDHSEQTLLFAQFFHSLRFAPAFGGVIGRVFFRFWLLRFFHFTRHGANFAQGLRNVEKRMFFIKSKFFY